MHFPLHVEMHFPLHVEMHFPLRRMNTIVPARTIKASPRNTDKTMTVELKKNIKKIG